jgi:hypothetical protein
MWCVSFLAVGAFSSQGKREKDVSETGRLARTEARSTLARHITW